jgi:hypothetical protein
MWKEIEERERERERKKERGRKRTSIRKGWKGQVWGAKPITPTLQG